MCQSLNQHIFFLWWLASLLFIVTLTNYLSLYKVWCWKRKKIYFGSCNPQSLPLILGPAFLSNILSTTASDNSWWLFSYILHELSILLPKAFLTFSAFWKLLSWHYHWCFLVKVPILWKLHEYPIFPTFLMTSCDMSYLLIMSSFKRLRECP